MKAQKIGWKYALLVLGLAILALLVMDFNSRTAELRRLKAERDVVSARVTSVIATNTTLKTQIAFATSDQAVEKWAYEDGHMVRPGDNPVVPLAPEDVTPTPTPAPEVKQVQLSNWQRWLALFVGPESSAP